MEKVKYKIRPFKIDTANQWGPYTIIPHDVIEFVMPALRPSAWMVLCVIMRKTVGWHKDGDEISLSQFMEHTGLAEGTVSSAIKELKKQRYILVEPTKGPKGMKGTNRYWLNAKRQMTVYKKPSSYTSPPRPVKRDPEREDELFVLLEQNMTYKGYTLAEIRRALGTIVGYTRKGLRERNVSDLEIRVALTDVLSDGKQNWQPDEHPIPFEIAEEVLAAVDQRRAKPPLPLEQDKALRREPRVEPKMEPRTEPVHEPWEFELIRIPRPPR